MLGEQLQAKTQCKGKCWVESFNRKQTVLLSPRQKEASGYLFQRNRRAIVEEPQHDIGRTKNGKYCMKEISLLRVKKCISHRKKVTVADFQLRIKKDGTPHWFFPSELERSTRKRVREKKWFEKLHTFIYCIFIVCI